MGSSLFERKPIAGQDVAPAVPPPEADPGGSRSPADQATAADGAADAIEMDQPAVEAEAAEAPPAAGVVEAPRPEHADTAAPAAAGAAHTDFSKLGAEIDAASALPSPYDRIARLSDVYRGPLLASWEACAAHHEAGGARIFAAREAEYRPVRDDYEAEAGAIDAERRTTSERTRSEIARLQRQQGEFVQTSNAALRDLWRRIGSGLELDEPVLPTSSGGPAVGGEAVADYGYDECRAQADRIPALAGFAEDPIFRDRFWWIAAAGLVLGWALFGSFGAGMATAFWVAGGALLWIFWRRSQARDTFTRLLDITSLEQGRRLVLMRAGVAGLERQLDEVISACGLRSRDAQSRRDQRLAGVNARFVGPLDTARRNWEADRGAFGGQLSTWTAALDTALAEQPARLDAWSALPGPDEPEPSLTDQLRVRLGREVLAEPRALDKGAAALIGAEATAPGLAGTLPPLFYDLRQKRSMLICDERPAGTGASGIMTVAVARMLMQLPPGKLNLTLFDPVGLGRNYSAFLKLGDYSDLLINGKVWSEKEHLRRKLKDLIEHIETVTQKYLRADFDDIETYNAAADQIAEAYRLLVVSDFPEGFDEESTKDLIRIVQNGARCGVFALVHVNRSAPLPYGVELAPLEQFCARLDARQNVIRLLFEDPSNEAGRPVIVDGPPPAELLDDLVKAFGEGARAAKGVAVPFQRMLQDAKIGEEDWWKASAEKGIEAPLGPAGAKKVQMMRLGSGLAHHALLVGRPGSGKSNLIHVFISTVARLYSPDEVEFYLVDFKKGVEFKAYADALLPHARVIAVESEREFGISVLQGLDAELKRRGELFRAAGTSGFAEYRGKIGEEYRGKSGKKFPRIILIVDEFQEFFSRDDRLSREAAILFDRLVRQGRAFGIHLILGTQSLANAGLQKATQDQMAVRIALQCSEADSRLILAEDNLVARSLTRPGEAIYNDSAGLIEGNSQFQVALFAEKDKARELAAISKIASRRKWEGEPPVVFEGHEPADLSASRPLQAASPAAAGKKLEMWLGEPTALKPSVTATFRRQSGRNMLVLTRDEEQGVGVVLAALSAIAAQSHSAQADFRIVDLTAADAAWADHPEAFADAVPHAVDVLGKRELRTLLPELEEEIAQRLDRKASTDPTIILAIIGLHRARDLRSDEMAGMSMSLDVEPSANLAQTLEKILQDGPEVGVHTILWCDSCGNLDRVIDRRGLNEIGLRVSATLSQTESHRIFDDDVAAGIDKPHRMVKFDDEHVGMFELFRPYALPTPAFLRVFATRLKAREALGSKETKNG